MECYNLSCKEECDEYKKATCLFRISKEVFEFKRTLGNRCTKCNERLVKGVRKKSREEVIICTNCLNISLRTGNKDV